MEESLALERCWPMKIRKQTKSFLARESYYQHWYRQVLCHQLNTKNKNNRNKIAEYCFIKILKHFYYSFQNPDLPFDPAQVLKLERITNMYPCISIPEILFNLLINAQPALHFNLSYSQFQEMDSLTHYIPSSLQINRLSQVKHLTQIQVSTSCWAG